jgi:polar amino acid transport system permease protein
VSAAVLSCAGAAALGFSFELLRRMGSVPRHIMRFVIDFIRSTPVLAWLYFTYFVLPFYGIRLSALTVGVLALSIYFSGYLAEGSRRESTLCPRANRRRQKRWASAHSASCS